MLPLDKHQRRTTLGHIHYNILGVVASYRLKHDVSDLVYKTGSEQALGLLKVGAYAFDTQYHKAVSLCCFRLSDCSNLHYFMSTLNPKKMNSINFSQWTRRWTRAFDKEAVNISRGTKDWQLLNQNGTSIADWQCISLQMRLSKCIFWHRKKNVAARS